jgi:hypothetical protein
MKSHTLSLAAIALVSLFACDHDAELALRPAIAEFELENVSFSENDGVKKIPIVLSKAAKEAGSLTVSIESPALAQFEFSPVPQSGKLILDVPQGSNRVEFSVRVIDNNNLDGMKTIGFTLLEASRGLQLGIKNTLETTWADDESPARIAFALQQSTLSESAGMGSIVAFTLSHAIPGDGQLTLSLSNSDALYGKDFTTVPAFENGALVLPVAAGATQVSFVVNPLNDALFNADRTINFQIAAVSSVLTKSGQISHSLTIKDDELAGRAKSYKTMAGSGWASSKEFHYAADGKLEKIVWATATPGEDRGERLFYYNADGMLDRVKESSVTYIKYIRENGRIVKSEEYDNDELDRYTLYGYDQAGNIGEVAIYDRQRDGSFVFSLQFVYLYYNDGNLYKKLAYQPQTSGDPVLLTTHTYENYLDVANPFSIEIVHGQPIQNKLPLTYREDTGSKVYEYSFTYEFLPGNILSSRTATGAGIRETTLYEYY